MINRATVYQLFNMGTPPEVVISLLPIPDMVLGLYNKDLDFVFVNQPAYDMEIYYSTVFHELGHATMHETRTNRLKAKNLRLEEEEAVADLTSKFLMDYNNISIDSELDKRLNRIHPSISNMIIKDVYASVNWLIVNVNFKHFIENKPMLTLDIPKGVI